MSKKNKNKKQTYNKQNNTSIKNENKQPHANIQQADIKSQLTTNTQNDQQQDKISLTQNIKRLEDELSNIADSINKLNTKQKDIQSHIQQQKEQITKAEQELKKTTQEKERIQKELNTMQGNNKALQQKIQTDKDKLDKEQGELESLKQELENKYKEFKYKQKDSKSSLEFMYNKSSKNMPDNISLHIPKENRPSIGNLKEDNNKRVLEIVSWDEVAEAKKEAERLSAKLSIKPN